MTNREWVISNLNRDGYFNLVRAACPPNRHKSPCPDFEHDESCGDCWEIWFNEEHYESEN